jgi:hypothetical protein
MGLSISGKVVERLKEQPGQRFKAREIAEWILERYPAACAEKMRNSKSLTTEAQLVQQLVAEIGANRPFIEHEWNQVRTTAERPRRYFWTNATDEAAVAEAEGKAAPDTPEPMSLPEREHDLYPKLTRFLAAEWQLHSKRIDEKTASNKNGPKGNQWLFPDLVAMEDLTRDLAAEVRDWLSTAGAKKVRLWGFELKLLLNRSNVAADIQGDETVRELRMLAALHGVGVIRLDSENPEDGSEVLIPARERVEIDWANANRLAAENKDFLGVVRLVRQFHQTGDPRAKDWDQP